MWSGVTHGLVCSRGNGSPLDALHCAIKKLVTDTKQNNTMELSHRVFQLGRSCKACDFHGPGRMMTNYAPIEDYKITSLLNTFNNVLCKNCQILNFYRLERLKHFLKTFKQI